MTKTKKIKGGVRLTHIYPGTREEAITDFLGNSTYTFVSNNTISCMAVLANLNAGIDSDFISCRSNNLDAPVRQMFVKLMLVDDIAANVVHHFIPGRGRTQSIEIATLASFKAEITTQNEIYRETLLSESSFFDSLCPSIVGTGTMLTPFLLPGLSDGQQEELNQIQAAVSGTIHLRFIAMEMMEGFRPANDIFPKYLFGANQGRYNFSSERHRYLYKIIQYEFSRLNNMGYFHGDAHFGNVMINPNYPYFSTDPRFIGRAIILDFGRTTRLTQENQARIAAGKMVNNNLCVYPLERFYDGISKNLDLTKDDFDALHERRIAYLDILKPRLIEFAKNNEELTNDTVIDYIKDQITNHFQHLYFQGGETRTIYPNNNLNNKVLGTDSMSVFINDAKNIGKQGMASATKMRNTVRDSANVSENNKMEKYSKFEIEESIRMDDEFLEKFKSHKPDWSEFLKPITKQLETMDFKEVIDILRDEYDNKYSKDIVLNLNPDKQKKNGGRIRSKKNRKTQKKTK